MWRRRSAIAVATVVESNAFPQSAMGKFVVINLNFVWCLALMTRSNTLSFFTFCDEGCIHSYGLIG